MKIPLPTKSTLAWILAIASSAGGTYVAWKSHGDLAAITAGSTALMSAAGILGWQSRSPSSF